MQDRGAGPAPASLTGLIGRVPATMGAAESVPAKAEGGPTAAPPAAQPSALVIVGPSGVGKGTLINRLMEEQRERFGFSCSHTTRPPREGEVVSSPELWPAGRSCGLLWAPPPPLGLRSRLAADSPHLPWRLQNGVHYHFTTHDKMEADIAAGKFLEYAHVHKNIYGTSIQVGGQAGGCSPLTASWRA